jgi:hypothetical protein
MPYREPAFAGLERVSPDGSSGYEGGSAVSGGLINGEIGGSEDGVGAAVLSSPERPVLRRQAEGQAAALDSAAAAAYLGNGLNAGACAALHCSQTSQKV